MLEVFCLLTERIGSLMGVCSNRTSLLCRDQGAGTVTHPTLDSGGSVSGQGGRHGLCWRWSRQYTRACRRHPPHRPLGAAPTPAAARAHPPPCVGRAPAHQRVFDPTGAPHGRRSKVARNCRMPKAPLAAATSKVRFRRRRSIYNTIRRWRNATSASSRKRGVPLSRHEAPPTSDGWPAVRAVYRAASSSCKGSEHRSWRCCRRNTNSVARRLRLMMACATDDRSTGGGHMGGRMKCSPLGASRRPWCTRLPPGRKILDRCSKVRWRIWDITSTRSRCAISSGATPQNQLRNAGTPI